MSFVFEFRQGPRSGQRLDLAAARATFGRSPECTVTVDDSELGWEHVRVELVGGLCRITDLADAGTYLGAEKRPVTMPSLLRSGDSLWIGASEIGVFYDQAVAGGPQQWEPEAEPTQQLNASIAAQLEGYGDGDGAEPTAMLDDFAEDREEPTQEMIELDRDDGDDDDGESTQMLAPGLLDEALAQQSALFASSTPEEDEGGERTMVVDPSVVAARLRGDADFGIDVDLDDDDDDESERTMSIDPRLAAEKLAADLRTARTAERASPRPATSPLTRPTTQPRRPLGLSRTSKVKPSDVLGRLRASAGRVPSPPRISTTPPAAPPPPRPAPVGDAPTMQVGEHVAKALGELRKTLVLSVASGPLAGTRLQANGPKLVLGGGGRADISLSGLGEEVAHIIWEGGVYVIRRVSSSEDLLVDGRPVPMETNLAEGCALEVGQHLAIVHTKAHTLGPVLPGPIPLDETEREAMEAGLAAFRAKSATGGAGSSDGFAPWTRARDGLLVVEASEMPGHPEDVPQAFRLQAKLIFLGGPHHGRTVYLGSAPTTIGADAGNAVVLSDATVSAQHCVIERSGSGHIVDNRSDHAVAVNGSSVAAITNLNHRDLLTIGSSILEYRGPNIDPLTEAAEDTTLVPQPRFCYEATVCSQWEVMVGSHPDCDFRIKAPGIEARHARLSFQDGHFFVETVRGAQVLSLGVPVEHEEIRQGAVLLFGQTPLEFDIDGVRCSVHRPSQTSPTPGPASAAPKPLAPAPPPLPPPKTPPGVPPAAPPSVPPAVPTAARQQPAPPVPVAPAPVVSGSPGGAVPKRAAKSSSRILLFIGLLVLTGFLILAVAVVTVVFVLI